MQNEQTDKRRWQHYIECHKTLIRLLVFLFTCQLVYLYTRQLEYY